LVTTSRRPTGAIRTLCRDLANSIPDVVRVNRGKMSLDGVAEKAIGLEADRVVVVDRWHGGPGKISLFRIAPTGLKPVPPLMYFAGVHLRREFKEGTRRVRSSIISMEPEDSPELERIAERLSQFFGLPLQSLDEAAGKHDASMHFSLNSSRCPQITFLLLSRMVEMGPRISLSKLVWEVSA
jgi:rRNA maturation protein Rpf1